MTNEQRIELLFDAMRRLAARGRRLREKQAAEEREAEEKAAKIAIESATKNQDEKPS